MKGQITSENILKKIAECTGISFDVLFEELVNSCQKMEYSTDRFIKLIAQIRHLGIRVVIATDNMDSFPRWTVPALGLEKMFDDILDSYTLKVLKRDFDVKGNSLFFSDYLRSVDIAPRECILIDDSEDKGNKIQNYGIEYRRIEPIIGLEPELISIINKKAKQP
jgi:FMN phosphatase YigB (HAD superfamily)